MKVYKVVSNNCNCSFFNIVCANSEKEALAISFETTGNKYLNMSDLEIEELKDLSTNLEEACIVTGTYID